MIRRFALGLAMAAALLAPAGAADAAGATFLVTRTEDTADGTCDAHCSLREAIEEGNALLGADSVSVPAGTYLLGLGPLNITDPLVLNGAGAADTVIDGQALDSVIQTSWIVGDVSISGVTIQNGKDGAVVNLANLTISDSVIKDSHSEFSMGGGIVNLWGALVLNRSTVTGNSAPSGAALDLDSQSNTFIINSTISGNVATITGNQVEPPGGAILVDGGLTILNSTIANNTGLAFSTNTNDPSLMFNSIVAGNSPANCAYTVPLGDHNLDSDGSCGFSGPGDLSNVDPLIGPLADNGGATPTHALLAGSPAIDGGGSSLCVIGDQRGVARAGASCDMGAYEAPAAPLAVESGKSATATIAGGSTFVVTKTADTADGLCDVADCSLREAIVAANNTPGPDSVTVPAGTYYLTIPPEPPPSPSNGDLDVTDDLKIVGAGARSTIIDGGGLDGILSVPDATSHVRVSGLTMRAAAGFYGTLVNYGFLAIDQAVIENNLEPISLSGGGITNEGALIVNRSTIKGNSGIYGGGVMVSGGSNALIVNSTVSANSAEEGAGINNDGSVTAMNSTIAFNEGIGLASLLPSGEAIMLNTIVANNTGDDCGDFVGGNHNLDTDGTCGLTGDGDRSFAQAMLGPLADNGGPTPTHALLPGGCPGDACVPPSEAINTGGNGYCLMVDQRGARRPLQDTCDMGAYEFGDKDADGTADAADNCPTVFNPNGQLDDVDGDLAGDACDGPGTGNVDCNGPSNGVTAVDALKVLRYVAGLSVIQNEPCLDIGLPRDLPPPADWKMGDVDCSGSANAVDALKILRSLAGLLVALPAGCPPIIGPPT